MKIAKYGTLKEAFMALNPRTRKALTRKAYAHNQLIEYNDAQKTSKLKLAGVYWRGKGAFKTNPESVRASVKSPDQWAMARVNSFLSALRNGRYRSGKHDTDLLPRDHPMRT